MTAVPPSLKALKPYLQHAKQTQKVDPLIAYYCKYYAATLGIEANPTDPQDKKFLYSLLDQLEAEKQPIKGLLSDPENQAPYVTRFCTKIFDKADSEDRAGNATKATARTFYAASIFFNTLRQFGELDPEVQEMLKYSKWKAADITTALREGRKPVPGPAGEENLEENLTPDFSTNSGQVDSFQSGSFSGNQNMNMPEDISSAPPPTYQPQQIPTQSVPNQYQPQVTEQQQNFNFMPPNGEQQMNYGSENGYTHQPQMNATPPQDSYSFDESNYGCAGEVTPSFGKKFMNTQNYSQISPNVSESDFPDPPGSISAGIPSPMDDPHIANGNSSSFNSNLQINRGNTPDFGSGMTQVPVHYFQPTEEFQQNSNSCNPPSVQQFQQPPQQPQTHQVIQQRQQVQTQQLHQQQSNQQPHQAPMQQFQQVSQNHQPNHMQHQQIQQPAQLTRTSAPRGPPIQYSDRPNMDEAYRYARFAVSSLQFEDIPTAILNLKRSLAQLGIRVE
mmetsp:Transcript_33149/g.51403  ORF Transcript_33149/g.51403 Transcript_33149/m.51403 type:complete len:502 (+) Transcript_33149:3-1508(+)